MFLCGCVCVCFLFICYLFVYVTLGVRACCCSRLYKEGHRGPSSMYYMDDGPHYLSATGPSPHRCLNCMGLTSITFSTTGLSHLYFINFRFLISLPYQLPGPLSTLRLITGSSPHYSHSLTSPLLSLKYLTPFLTLNQLSPLLVVNSFTPLLTTRFHPITHTELSHHYSY